MSPTAPRPSAIRTTPSNEALNACYRDLLLAPSTATQTLRPGMQQRLPCQDTVDRFVGSGPTETIAKRAHRLLAKTLSRALPEPRISTAIVQSVEHRLHELSFFARDLLLYTNRALPPHDEAVNMIRQNILGLSESLLKRSHAVVTLSPSQRLQIVSATQDIADSFVPTLPFHTLFMILLQERFSSDELSALYRNPNLQAVKDGVAQLERDHMAGISTTLFRLRDRAQHSTLPDVVLSNSYALLLEATQGAGVEGFFQVAFANAQPPLSIEQQNKVRLHLYRYMQPAFESCFVDFDQEAHQRYKQQYAFPRFVERQHQFLYDFNKEFSQLAAHQYNDRVAKLFPHLAAAAADDLS